ncbi:MAG: hypothetical protein AAGA85_27350 [Bacteroidota bacterium]
MTKYLLLRWIPVALLMSACSVKTTETVHQLIVTNQSSSTVHVRAASPHYPEAFERSLPPAGTQQWPANATLTMKSLGGDQPYISDRIELLEDFDSLLIEARIGTDDIEMGVEFFDRIEGSTDFNLDDNFDGWLTMTKYFIYRLEVTDEFFED